MTDVFVSYARSDAAHAERVADALRAAGLRVWRDDQLPVHRAYTDVIEQHIREARAVVVLWSADAARSEWVRSEANAAREQRKLVQLTLDGARLPMPFDQIQCADLSGWGGDVEAPAWRKVLASTQDLVASDPHVRASAATTSQPTAPLSSPPVPDSPGHGKPSLAVLPFANLAGDSENVYFVEGIVAEIVEALARSRSVMVMGASSSAALHAEGIGPLAVGRRLGVRYVLEGSVRRAGPRVRVGVQMLEASSGATIWSERFDDTTDAIFELQDRIALAVAARVEPEVEQAEIRRALAHPTGSRGSSQDLYFRALPVFRRFTKESSFEALRLLEEAIALDARHAGALALAVSCHRTIMVSGWSDDIESHRAAGIDLGRRAIAAAPDDARVLASVANDLTVLERSVDTALPLARRAIALHSGSANVCFNCGCVQVLAGEHAAAIEHLETALRLDPVGATRPVYLLWLAAAHLFLKHFDQAAALLRERNQYGESPPGVLSYAVCCGHLGQLDAGRAALARYRELSPLPPASFAQIWLVPEDRALVLRGIELLEPAQ